MRARLPAEAKQAGRLMTGLITPHSKNKGTRMRYSQANAPGKKIEEHTFVNHVEY